MADLTLNDILNKTCLIGLTYTSSSGEVLKQTELAGTVIQVDAEEGISVKLNDIADRQQDDEMGPAIFHLPPSMEAWFIAEPGHYSNPEKTFDITDPDFFVTWYIVKKKDDTPEGVHEWWEWYPQTTSPKVN